MTKEYEAIVLDGLYIHLRTIPKVFKNTFKYSKKRRRDTQGVILAAMGITEDGTKEILGFKIAYSESEAEWFSLLSDLLNRGLNLKQDGIVIHDGSKGLISAIDAIFTYHKKQLCVFHFIMAASSYAKNISQRKLIQNDLSYIYSLSKNYKTANKLFFNFISKWRPINPSLASFVRNYFASTLLFLEFPQDKHKIYSTTNYLERTFKEFNRKTYDIGVFPNVYSAERIVFLLVLEQNLKNTGVNPFYA